MAKKVKAKPANQLPFEVKNQGSRAELKIVGEIGWWSTSGDRFIELVDGLLAAGVQDSHLYINTPGGSMFDGYEIGNQIMRFPGLNTCQVGSLCASAGTLVTSRYKKENVKASPNSQFMFHDPAMTPRITRMEDFESNKKLYTNLRNEAINTYNRQTGISKEELSEMMKAVTWLNAEEAKAKGFVGSVEGEDDPLLPADTLNVLNKYGFEVPEVLNSLLDAEEEEEETAPEETTPPNTVPNNPTNTMKKEQLIALFGLTTVTASSSDDDVAKAVQAKVKAMLDTRTAILTALCVTANENDDTAVLNAITKAFKEKTDKVTELTNKLQAQEDAKLKAVLDIAQNDEQKITAEERTKMENLAKTVGVSAIVEMLALRPARTKLSNLLDNSETPNPENLTAAVYARIAKMDAEQAAK